MSVSTGAAVSRPSYLAFISYSHRDKAHARWLHNALERYRVPARLVGTQTVFGAVPARLTPIFRDRDELPASGNLGAELQTALKRSRFLIVICSPASARSTWVNEEVRSFKQQNGGDQVLALIVDGIPNARGGKQDQECFVPALKYVVTAEGEISETPAEPIAADLRKQADGRRLAMLKLICGLTGLPLDTLVQRESARRIRTLVQISAASLFAAVCAIGLALYANDRRIEANTQRLLAEQESRTATAVSDFLVDIFADANPVAANPSEITARSILDRGAQRLNIELDGQPQVQSRLSSSIALAYNNLGLFNQAIDVIDSTAASSGIQHASAYLIKAEALRRQGNPDAALDTVSLAMQFAGAEQKSAVLSPQLVADGARIQALVHYQLGQHSEGLAAFDRALAALNAVPQRDTLEVAKLLQNRALLLSDTGEFTQAAEDLSRAESLVLASAGDRHILYGQIALADAQVNFLGGQLPRAAERIGIALNVMAQLLDADNPSLADAYSMQGQILHALGQLAPAEAALNNAVRVYTQAYGGRHYLSGIAEVYLGLIAGDRHDLTAALAHFDEARQHYDAGYGTVHPNHGDLLVNRATVLAAAGELSSARQDCRQGMTILNDTLGQNAAFTQQLQAVCDDIVARP